MSPEHVVEVGAEAECPRMIAARALSPATRERIEYPDGGRLGGRARVGIAHNQLQPGSRERPAANRAKVLRADGVDAIAGRVPSLGFVVAADAGVVSCGSAEAVSETQRLIQ